MKYFRSIFLGVALLLVPVSVFRFSFAPGDDFGEIMELSNLLIRHPMGVLGYFIWVVFTTALLMSGLSREKKIKFSFFILLFALSKRIFDFFVAPQLGIWGAFGAYIFVMIELTSFVVASFLLYFCIQSNPQSKIRYEFIIFFIALMVFVLQSFGFLVSGFLN
jgi:hypothetical protein